MKRDKILYYIATGLLTAMMLLSVSQYFFNHDAIVQAFESFGYPTYLIYPYGTIKLIGLVVLWLPGLKALKEWTYSGFFFAFVLAFFAHFMVSDGQHFGAVIALVLLLLSYFFYRRING